MYSDDTEVESFEVETELVIGKNGVTTGDANRIEHFGMKFEVAVFCINDWVIVSFGFNTGTGQSLPHSKKLKSKLFEQTC